MTWYRKGSANNLVLSYIFKQGQNLLQRQGCTAMRKKIKLACANEGKANAVLLKFVAKTFNVPLSQVILKLGAKSRHKIVEIRQTSLDPDVLFNSLAI